MFSIPLAWATVKAVAAKVPREVWYALAVALLLWLAYNRGAANERDEIEAQLKAAADAAKIESMERIAEGDRAGAIRAEKEAAVIAEQVKAIEEAEAAGGNPLDSLF